MLIQNHAAVVMLFSNLGSRFYVGASDSFITEQLSFVTFFADFIVFFTSELKSENVSVYPLEYNL